MDRSPVIGFALPPFIFSGKSVIIIDKGAINVDGFNASGQQFPLILKVAGLNDFTFPIDPVISVGLKNIITRRTISKGGKRGTVKERWTEDDADISISGVFINKGGEYPDEVSILQGFFEKHEAISVTCTFLNQKGIDKIAIESLDFPHTKGAENQAFEIKAYSDDVFQLLIEN